MNTPSEEEQESPFGEHDVQCGHGGEGEREWCHDRFRLEVEEGSEGDEEDDAEGD